MRRHSTSRRWIMLVVSVAACAGLFAFVSYPMSAEERREARFAAINLLNADAAVGRMPADLRGRRRVFETQADERLAALKKVWTPGVVYLEAKDWEDGIAAFYADPTYEPYTDNRFVVTDWRKIRRVPGGVHVVVRGYMSYRDAKSGEWVGSTEGTEHLTLVRMPGGWRILNNTVTEYYP